MNEEFVERAILEAIARGEFDDLPGSGEPLHLGDAEHTHPAWRMAFHVLQNAGLAPAWLEEQKTLRLEIAKARQRLRSALMLDQRSQREGAIERFHAECRRLNRLIMLSNLQVPVITLHLKSLKARKEVEAALSAVEKKNQP